MKRTLKKLISLFLALVLMVGMVPVSAFVDLPADGIEDLVPAPEPTATPAPDAGAETLELDPPAEDMAVVSEPQITINPTTGEIGGTVTVEAAKNAPVVLVIAMNEKLMYAGTTPVTSPADNLWASRASLSPDVGYVGKTADLSMNTPYVVYSGKTTATGVNVLTIGREL
ncbi:MAG: hypothetical protein RSB55_10585, partial [Oscillospiraceae bacterium]